MDWRNPFEDFRDKYLSPKNVKGYQLFLLRLGFIPYSIEKVPIYEKIIREYWNNSISESEVQFFISAYRDMKTKNGFQISSWITKFFNARFSFVINVAIWKFIPLPYVGLSIRCSKEKYFQLGIGFGAEGKFENGIYERACLSGKLRIGDFRNEYIYGGNYDVYDIYEGIV